MAHFGSSQSPETMLKGGSTGKQVARCVRQQVDVEAQGESTMVLVAQTQEAPNRQSGDREDVFARRPRIDVETLSL